MFWRSYGQCDEAFATASRSLPASSALSRRRRMVGRSDDRLRSGIAARFWRRIRALPGHRGAGGPAALLRSCDRKIWLWQHAAGPPRWDMAAGAHANPAGRDAVAIMQTADISRSESRPRGIDAALRRRRDRSPVRCRPTLSTPRPSQDHGRDRRQGHSVYRKRRAPGADGFAPRGSGGARRRTLAVREGASGPD